MKPLLPATLETLSDVRYPMHATPKLDGIRCLIWQVRALTRKLRPIPNWHIRHALESQAALYLDGELMMPRADFNGV